MKWRDYIKKCAMMACVSLATLWGFVVYAAPGFTMRIDDNHSVAEWERVAEIFGSRGIRLSFAVVTSTLSEDQGKCLRRFSEKGHVIMDHTPNHTFYRAKYHDRAAFDRAKVKPFVVEVNEPEMTLFFRCEADDAHPKNRRVRASIDKNVITFENAQGVHGSYEFIKIPGHEGVYGLAKGQKSFELRDFWRRPLTGTIDLAATEVLVYDQAALQPCDDVLRELANISRERFDHFGLPRPTIWVRPGGWDPGVSWDRIERIYGREFGYVGADSTVNARKGSSRWTTGYDAMRFFDQGADITPEQLVDEIEQKLARGLYHVALSHMWHKTLPAGQKEWFEKTERFARLLVERKIPAQTMAESLVSRFGERNCILSPRK